MLCITSGYLSFGSRWVQLAPLPQSNLPLRYTSLYILCTTRNYSSAGQTLFARQLCDWTVGRSEQSGNTVVTNVLRKATNSPFSGALKLPKWHNRCTSTFPFWTKFFSSGFRRINGRPVRDDASSQVNEMTNPGRAPPQDGEFQRASLLLETAGRASDVLEDGDLVHRTSTRSIPQERDLSVEAFVRRVSSNPLSNELDGADQSGDIDGVEDISERQNYVGTSVPGHTSMTPAEMIQLLLAQQGQGPVDGNSMVDRHAATSASSQSGTWRLVSEAEMTAWLDSASPLIQLGHLKQLMRYICELSGAECPAIVHAMRRVTSSFITIPETEEAVLLEYLEVSFCSCFKALVYLERHGKHFDLDLVSDIVAWRSAYREIATFCKEYKDRCCGEVSLHHVFYSQCAHMINYPVTSQLLADLKSMAYQTGEWQPHRLRSPEHLYGPKLQPSETIDAAKLAASQGNAKWEDLDDRQPNGPMTIERELITLIMAHVAAVDKVMNVTRDPSEWESLREVLLAFGVCDRDGRPLSGRNISRPSESYGLFRPDRFDMFTPIGFYQNIFSCYEKGILKENPSTQVRSIEFLDASTVRIQRPSGTVELLAFALDVEYAGLFEKIQLLSTSELVLGLQYKPATVLQEYDTERVDDIINDIRKMWIGGESISHEPDGYPGPRGIEAIAFVLQNPWRNWRGVGVVDGAVFVVAMNELRRALEAMETARGLREPTRWDGMLIDPEVIAITRGIEKKPASWILAAYLAHIATISLFKWKRLSETDPVIIAKPNVIVLPNADAVERFLLYETQMSVHKLEDSGVVGSKRKQLLVRALPPFDLLALTVGMAALCIIPAATRPSDMWRDSISEAIQNLGTGLVPVVLIYSLAFYQGWDVRDMLLGRKACDSLEIASKVTGKTKEAIATSAKARKIARDTFETAGNSVPLSGGEGFGETSSVGGLGAIELAEAGAIFVTRGDPPEAMVDVGGYLALNRDPDSRLWHAETAQMPSGSWRLMDRKELEDIRIS